MRRWRSIPTAAMCTAVPMFLPPSVTGALKSCTMHASMLLVVVLVGMARGDNITISPPDIYPSDRSPFPGEVTITMVSNQPSSTIFYTINGGAPNNRSRVYRTPLSLFEPGEYTVQARAISNTGQEHLLDSVIVSRVYTITPSDVAVPHVSPPKGQYRGFVTVTLIPPLENQTVQYVVDVDSPGDTWLTFTNPFVLDIPGEHIVKARTVVSGKFSPIARYRYYVTPPLLYDVSTECAKCLGQPTLGKWFSIWLQGAEIDSTLFLTTSSKGCENNRHMLDDTSYVKVNYRQVSYRFRTLTEPQPKVFVCLLEPSHPNQTFVTVPKRILSSRQGATEPFFSIEPAFGAIRHSPTEAPAPTSPPFSAKPSFSITFVVSFGVLIVILFATFSTLTNLLRTRGHHHRVPRAEIN